MTDKASLIAALRISAAKGIPTIAEHPELMQYLNDHNAPFSDSHKALREEVNAHEKGFFAASPDEAIFLAWMCKTIGAKKVIEVGVFLGSTALAIAEALPENGKLVALDLKPQFTSVGEKYWKQAGVDKKIDLRIAPAAESLKKMVDDPSEIGTYDFAFIDADKENIDTYYEYSLQLIRVGGVIAVDNVFAHAMILAEDIHPVAKAIRDLNDKLAKDKRVEISITTLADGVTLVRKL